LSEAVYLALGANLGDRLRHLGEAVRRLADLGEIEATSWVYESAPMGGLDQPLYLNAVVRMRTDLEPAALLKAVKEIERTMGRKPAERWASRPIDIDIVLYGNRVIVDETLVIPHPGMRDRNFVLRPLLDIEPDLTDPRDGAHLMDALATIGDNGLTKWPDTLLAPPPAR
jgi:2-amino-4-hydroxy-6-hydroxymethyldihydropteridine diphosphokinase